MAESQQENQIRLPMTNNPATAFSTTEHQKPMLKVLERVLQPRDAKTKRFTRPRQERRRKSKQSYY